MRIHRINTANGAGDFAEYEIDNFEGALTVNYAGAGGSFAANGAMSGEPEIDTVGLIQIALDDQTPDWFTVKTGFKITLSNVKPRRVVKIRYLVQSGGYIEILTYKPSELVAGY